MAEGAAAVNGAVEEVVRLLRGHARRDVPVGPMTTYRVGGRASVFVAITDEEVLENVCGAVVATGVPVLTVGNGSNLLVSDAGFRGLALKLADRFAGISADGCLVRAGAAGSYPVLARKSAASGLAGMEWAVGIPGSVGGAVRMNAGGHGAETKDRLVEALVVDLSSAGGQPRALSRAELGFRYRHSVIDATDLVLEATFELERGDAAASMSRIKEIVRWRRENQPGGQNAGSVFTNPPGDSAGRIIESLGLKGLRIGSAAVSTKHANFVQADEGGSADDVRRVIEVVQLAVAERAGIDLALEVRWIEQ